MEGKQGSYVETWKVEASSRQLDTQAQMQKRH